MWVAIHKGEEEWLQVSSRSGSLHLGEELVRVRLPAEKVGKSLPLQVTELYILSLLDIWAAPNEAYITAT